MYIVKPPTIPSAATSLPVSSNWIGDLECITEDYSPDELFSIILIATDDSEFTITASSDEVPVISLQASVSVNGYVDTGAYKYYSIYKNLNSDELDISLTIFQGDADIFIGFNSLPTVEDNDKQSVTIGNDFIKLSIIDFINHDFHSGEVFIGIYGARTSTYSLVASVNANGTVKLNEGMPQEATVSKDEIMQYYFPFSMKESDFSVYLTTIHGDTSMYLKFCEQKCSISKEDIKNPTMLKSSTGNDALKILHIDFLHNKCSDSLCSYAIGVLGKITSYFSIVVSSSTGAITMQEGKTTIMSAPTSGYKYFEYFTLNTTITEINFILSPIYGNPDLYISTQSFPSIDNFEKSSQNSDIETDQIIFVRGEQKETLSGAYYISVYSNEGSYFSLTVKEMMPTSNTTIQLYPGHPQRDTIYNINNKGSRYYYFHVPGYDLQKPPIQIMLTALTGEYVIYVSNNETRLDLSSSSFSYN